MACDVGSARTEREARPGLVPPPECHFGLVGFGCAVDGESRAGRPAAAQAHHPRTRRAPRDELKRVLLNSALLENRPSPKIFRRRSKRTVMRNLSFGELEQPAERPGGEAGQLLRGPRVVLREPAGCIPKRGAESSRIVPVSHETNRETL